MSEIIKSGGNFVGYEYMEVNANGEKASLYMDGYINFGWNPDENMQPVKNSSKVMVKLKRDRKIINKVELTRLQKHFEACVNEIDSLEKSKTSVATMVSITIGIIGTAFMALSTFAITSEQPMIIACIVYAIPGFIGWVLPYFVYKALVKKRTAKLAPLIEQKYDEIYDICEKGNNLLGR